MSTSITPINSYPGRVVQPPRPPNAWILYRSDKIRELPPLPPGTPRRAQAEVSKMISAMWKNETETIRNHYERLADTKKAQHQLLYPNYRFQPMKKEDKERMKTEKKSEKEKERAQSRRVRYRIPYVATAIPTTIQTIIPIYRPDVRQGPAGPSPPLSAASSPDSDSPLDDYSARLKASSTTCPVSSTSTTPLSPIHLVTTSQVATSPQQHLLLATTASSSQLPSSSEHNPADQQLVTTPLNPSAVSVGNQNSVQIMADPLELSQDEIFQYLFSQPGLGTPHDFALPEPSADFDFDLGSERIAELAEAQTAPGYTSFAENFFGQTEFPFPLDIPDNTSSPISSPNTSGVPSRGLSPDSGPDPDPGYDDFLSLLFADEIQQNLGADMMQYLNLDGSSSQATSEPSAQPSESGLPIEAKSAAESSSSQALADISNRDPTASDKAFGDIAEALLASLTTADAPTQ